jgi:anionic cell wall polymer biosynthesis LytR-Cps2A-Psr (LCP) family protein
VDIDVTTPLYDPLFPCDDGTKLAGKYCPINFKVGEQHMDGEQALEYSRSRETTSDFARAARQQQVILALRQKALTLSTLTNPIKLGNLIDAVGGTS